MRNNILGNIVNNVTFKPKTFDGQFFFYFNVLAFLKMGAINNLAVLSYLFLNVYKLVLLFTSLNSLYHNVIKCIVNI